MKMPFMKSSTLGAPRTVDAPISTGSSTKDYATLDDALDALARGEITDAELARDGDLASIEFGKPLTPYQALALSQNGINTGAKHAHAAMLLTLGIPRLELDHNAVLASAMGLVETKMERGEMFGDRAPRATLVWGGSDTPLVPEEVMDKLDAKREAAAQQAQNDHDANVVRDALAHGATEGVNTDAN